MNPESSVIDEIDRLVEESLARPYAERSGYDNAVNQPRCPHWDCVRQWHGLPVGRCPGSGTHGPAMPWKLNGPVVMTRDVPVGDPQVGARVQVMDGDGTIIGIGRTTQFSLRLSDEAMQAFDASMRQMREAVITVSQRWAEAIGLWQIPDDPGGDEPVAVEETRQQRALPRPSSTPPMWANDPTRNRRRRR